MTRTLLVRGLTAGVVAGLLAFVFARVVGEAALGGALAYEELVADHHSAGGPELVDRGTQSGIGLAVAYLIYGVAVGGVLSLVHASLLGRLGPLGARGTATAVAVLGFVAAVLTPFLRYPANPPASTIDDTVGARTAANIVLVVASILLAVGAVALARRLAARIGWWNAALTSACTYIVAVVAVAALLPTFSETPADFPATVLYDFRLASMGGQVVLWAVWTVVFAALAERSATRSMAPAPG